MKRFILLSAVMMFSIMLSAQTQQGYVKTKGRLANDGSVIAGTRIPNVTIQVKDRTPMVSQDNGTFSFPIPANKFYLQNVQKQGYVLTDPEVLSKQYTYSPNDLIIVMEDLAQQEADRRAIERKISSKLYAQLQQRGEELESLKEQNKITDEKYRELLQKLNKDQDDNEKIIQEMVERYAKMDFDQIDEFNRKVSEYILNGELMKADSLVNSKGDLNQRAKEYQKHKAINEMEREELTRRQATLELSETAMQKELEVIANDCYSKFEICKLQHLNDSAAYWIELRAMLDTTNLDWLSQAGLFNEEYSADYNKSLSLFHLALRQALFQNGEQDGKTACLYNNIGTVLNTQGDYLNALKYFNKALPIYQTVFGEDSPEFAICTNNIGLVYYNLGNYSESLDYYIDALNIWNIFLEKKTPEAVTKIPSVTTCISNIASVFSELRDYESALKYHEKALSIEKTILGEMHPSIALSYNNIGVIYNDQGNYEKALEYHEKALIIFKAFFCENHPYVGMSYNNIGLVHHNLGQDEKALDYYKKHLTISKTIFGENHASTAQGYTNIGLLYYDKGEYDKAMEYIDKSLLIRLSVYGNEHLDIAENYYAMGLLYYHKGEYDKAIEYINKSLLIRIPILGEENTDVVGSYFDLGSLYYLQNNHLKSLEYYQKCYKIRSSTLGEDHTDTIKTLKNIEIVQAKLKEQENEQKTEE